MALTIETGAIVSGADSYISLADAGTYHADNGNAAWVAVTDDATKEAALRKACRYLDGHYRLRWKGVKTQPVTQPLEWPRMGVQVVDSRAYDSRYSSEFDLLYSGCLASDVIPQRLKDAQCELALRALSGDLAADGTQGVKREKIDVIETEYFAGATQGASYPVVDQLLSDYLIQPGSGDLLRG